MNVRTVLTEIVSFMFSADSEEADRVELNNGETFHETSLSCNNIGV